MEKKKFAAIVLHLEDEIFVVYNVYLSFITSFSFTLLNADVYPFRTSQISNLIVKEAPTKVLVKYVNFADIFSLDLAMV